MDPPSCLAIGLPVVASFFGAQFPVAIAIGSWVLLKVAGSLLIALGTQFRGEYEHEQENEVVFHNGVPPLFGSQASKPTTRVPTRSSPQKLIHMISLYVLCFNVGVGVIP